MNLIRLLKSAGNKPLRRLMGDAIASSLGTTAVLGVVTYAAQEINASRREFVDMPLAILFAAGVILFMFAESRMIARLAASLEEAIDSLRMRLIQRLRHADLWKLEHFGQSRLYDSITQSCRVISSNSQYLAQAMRSVVLIVTILLYIAAVSVSSFFLLSTLLAAASFLYYRFGLALEERQANLADQEAGLFECVSDLFDGFQEQRLNSSRGAAINQAFSGLSAGTMTLRNDVHLHAWQQFVFGETTFNLMMGVVVFVAPIYSPSISGQLVKLASAILFMVAPVFGLMQSLAVLRAAEAAAGRMLALEEELEDLEEPGSTGPAEPVPADFTEIRLEGVEFAFPAANGEQPFVLGPLEATFRAGETVFITGGNGSGKSTFLKLLTGLYHPRRGRLSIDGTEITASRMSSYRGLMAPVFSGFHLFARLYGLGEIDRTEADGLMALMEMERIAELREDRFSRTGLSTGQRKRLALVAALLEVKPVLILDEWAADQDAAFRRKFYREILPELKARGLTIIAVTHDDRYFDAADRRLHVEEGRITEIPVIKGTAA